MIEKISPDGQPPLNRALIAAAVAAARDDRRGIGKPRRHGGAYTFDVDGTQTILADDMRPFVDLALGDELVECGLPGMDDRLNLVPMARAIELGICTIADIGHRRPTGHTNDASVLAPNCNQCLAIIPRGNVTCDNCSGTAPDTVDAPTRADMIVLLRKVHRLITEGQRSMLDDDVTPLVQDLTDEAIGLAQELELAAAMEAALVELSECGWLARDVREIPSVAKAKAVARDVVDDILLIRLPRD